MERLPLRTAATVTPAATPFASRRASVYDDGLKMKRSSCRARRVVCCAAFGTLAVLVRPPGVDATTTQLFTQTTVEDFEEGEATGTSVTAPGQVEPGLTSRRFAVDSAFLWSSALSRDGSTAYFGGGDPGRVYSVPVAGGQPRMLAQLPEPWVTALAAEGGDSLLAATTPGAKLYRVSTKDGKYKEIAHLDTEHIWSLVYDEKKRLTYAATGVSGKVVVIDAQAKVKVLWSADDQHLVSLVPDGQGGMLAGSAEKAILFRISDAGKARAIADFEAQEVRAIATVGNVTYVAVNNFESGESEDKTIKDKGAKGIALVIGGNSPAAPGKLPRPGAPKAKGAVYRVEAGGAIESVLTLSQGYFTSLLADKAGNVFAAAGSEGKVYRIDVNRNTALVLDLAERQALSLLLSPRGFLVGSGDAGAVYAAELASPAQATYLSKVFDAARFAKWGRLRYGASASLAIETRSGNTAKPDANWDGWVKLLEPAFANNQGFGRVASPAARYVQYRVNLPSSSVLRETVLSYRPQNLRPRLVEMTLADPPSPTAEKREHSPLLKLRFKVENPDNDTLSYRLSYKRETDTLWRPVVPADEAITKAEYDWNTEAVPDGDYVVRVQVSDAPSVYQDDALDFTFTSAPVLVDNTRPAIANLSATAPTLSGQALDVGSAITAIEFQIDGGQWHAASVADGLLDQKTEGFSLKLPRLSPGDHSVAVRAFDAANNLGVAHVVVTIKGSSK